MAIKNELITSGGGIIFTCPGTVVTDVQEHAVTCMIFCNVSASAATLDLHVIPVGDSLDTANYSDQIIKQLSIPAGETFSFDTEKLVLTTGDRVYARANADSRLVVTISSMRVS